MFTYLKKTRDLTLLIATLKGIELIAILRHGAEHGEGLSFKFGTNDTICTTIHDIGNDLNLPSSHNNHKLIVEKMESIIGLEPDDELIVSYS